MKLSGYLISCIVALVGCKSDSTDPGDTTAPTVSITSPAPLSVVSDSVLVEGSTADGSGVAKVEFYIDGALAYTKAASPWEYKWPTQNLAVLSAHSIVLKAYDVAGNVGASSGVSVTIKMGNFEYRLDSNTVGLWHLNETGGGSALDVAGANNGTISGTTSTAGRFGQARSFSVNGDNVRIAFLPAYKVQTFTVEAWVMNTSATPVSLPCIVGMVDGSSSDGGGSLAINGDLTFTFGVRGTTGPMVVNSTSMAAVGEWKHVAAVRTSDGTNTTLTLYINGVLEAQQAFLNNVAQFANTTYIYFGDQGDNLGNGSRHWSGSIDEVRFSNRERIPHEFNVP